MSAQRHHIIRITTVAISMNKLLRNQLKFMSRYFTVTGITSPDQLHVGEIEQREGINVISVMMTRAITPLADIVALFRLYRIFRKLKPTIVHTHTPKAGLLGMMASWMARVPVRLHTLAGLPMVSASGLRRRIFAAAEKATFRFAHRVYPNSFGLRDVVLQNRLCAPGKLKVIANGSSNGIDTEWFSKKTIGASNDHSTDTRRQLSIPDGAFVFCFVGRLVVDKGIFELCEAFTKLQEASGVEPVYLLLVGPLENLSNGLDRVTLEKIENNLAIVTTGSVSDVRSYLACSDVFAFPSYREGFPNALLQAGAMELPSIVSNINGCNEIIRDGHNGVIVPVKDSRSLFMAMQKLYVDRDFCGKLRANARESIVKRFQQKYVLQELLSEYESWISKLSA